ncbi:Amt family ammonium transporter [Rhodobium orientis]|nr:ammonium transporter [Rhodobium orientis]MBB4301040.1 Amt family ammonium transporter [Rhodobium orientis]
MTFKGLNGARWMLLASVLMALLSTPAAASEVTEAIAAVQRKLDFAWVLIAAALVLLMQVGFLLVEAGMVRSKNAINVAQKNLLDFVFSVVVFAAIGFMFAFGGSTGFWIGIDSKLLMLSDVDAWGLTFFVFQVMFCGTAATIVSGAVAERMRLSAYVLCSIFISGLVYPAFVHWAWGTALVDSPGAFLAHMGFVDFAGSTVVHGTGAWIALAACIVIGARHGRFDADGNPVRFHGHSPVLATAGAILLFVGWIGFNGGSTLEASPAVAHVIANTVLAAATGGTAGYLLGWWRERVLLPDKVFSGLLGGLVAVTAGCMALKPGGALIVGFLGGASAVIGIGLLERRLHVDDAVGAVGVHGVAGVVGTLGVALLAPVENLPAGGRLAQLGVQALGSGVNFVWAFGLGLVFFHLLGKIILLRVDAHGEEIGLNESEHGTRLGIGHVEDAVGRLVDGKADLGMRLPVEPGDEAERMTRLFNALMDAIENEEIRRGLDKEMRRDDEESERLSALANATFDSIVISVEGVVIDGNAALETLIGLPLSRIKGRSIEEFVDNACLPLVAEQMQKADTGPYELILHRADGAEIPVEVRAREIIYRGLPTRVAAIVDLRERKAAEEQIRHLAQHDPLTDLPNRAVFTDRLVRSITLARTKPIGIAVILIDLDHFKDVNDLHGHPVGDKVIAATGERLRQLTRHTDTVARLGGDEFAIVQADVQFANQAADLSHRVVSILSQPIDCGDGLVVRVGASLGVALCPAHGDNPETLMSRADTALYRAKIQGRNTYCIFEEGMDAAVRKRRVLEADLSAAIEEEQFVLYLQPRLDLHSAGITAYEALIRWNHPKKGLIEPADFIPVAEQSARIVGIGEWVLKRACEMATQQLGAARISVNVSPLQFRDRGFLDSVRNALEESGLKAERLEIEITENVLIEDDERALEILKALKKLGVGISLDDFGTGYSSLSYLSRFPFDAIKIDRSFVHSVSRSENVLAIVETIVRLGRALGMRIVAEGVETAEQLVLLQAEGCDEIQGYLIGRPQPLGSHATMLPDQVVDALHADPVHDRDPIAQLKHAAARMRDAGKLPILPASGKG